MTLSTVVEVDGIMIHGGLLTLVDTIDERHTGSVGPMLYLLPHVVEMPLLQLALLCMQVDEERYAKGIGQLP